MTKQLEMMDGPSTTIIPAMCSVDACGAIANRVGAGLCEKHYGRLRRNGTTEKLQPNRKIQHSHGYVLVHAPDHQLSAGKPSGTRIYEHRMKFYDAYGYGDHKCHWCEASVTFNKMHVDHLNAIRDDNRLENLVASCPDCNMSRGLEKMRKTMRERGMMIEFNGKRKHVSEWASDLGISAVSMKNRISSGWDLAKALTEPRGKFGPKSATGRA